MGGGDYENWEDTLENWDGTLINLGGGAPMVKIKDFTLASKNGGEGTCPPFPTHLPPMSTRTINKKYDMLPISLNSYIPIIQLYSY